MTGCLYRKRTPVSPGLEESQRSWTVSKTLGLFTHTFLDKRSFTFIMTFIPDYK